PASAISRIRSRELLPSARLGPLYTVTAARYPRAAWANRVAGRMCNPFGLATVTVRRSGPLAGMPLAPWVGFTAPPSLRPAAPPSVRRAGPLDQVPYLVPGLARPQPPDELLVPQRLHHVLQGPQVVPRPVLGGDQQDHHVDRLAVDRVERDAGLRQPDRPDQ